MKDVSGKNSCYVPDLESHIINLADSQKEIKFSEIIPQKICPFLLHSSLPYIYTLSQGGRFPWMALEKNKDSVFFQCPNPGGKVVASVYKEDGRMFIRVIEVKGECCFGYEKDDICKVTPEEDIKVPLTIIDACFAWLTCFGSRSDRASLLSPDMVVEEQGKKIAFLLKKIGQDSGNLKPFERLCSKLEMSKQINVRLSSFDYRCRYFKWPHRENYNNENFGPKDLCVDLFHLSHIFAMASIYANSKNNRPLSLLCGDKKGCVKLSVHIKKTKTYLLRKMLISALRLFRINKEVPVFICELVVEESSSECPMKLKKGMKFIYNMGRKYELCPASFDSLYFLIHNTLRGSNFSWGRDRSGKDIAVCPDAVSNAAFSLEN